MEDAQDGIKAAMTFAAFVVTPALFGAGLFTGFLIWGFHW